MIRRILEAIAEKELHPARGMGQHPSPDVTDRVEDLLSVDTISIHDWSEPPDSNNPVEMWVVHMEDVLERVFGWVQERGFLWTWDDDQHVLRLSPGPGQTVASFWTAIVKLVDDYYKLIDIDPVTGDTPVKGDDGDDLASEINKINEVAFKEGWAIFHTGKDHPWEIEKDDEADVFEYDDDAVDFVKAKAAKGSALHQKALQITTPGMWTGAQG